MGNANLLGPVAPARDHRVRHPARRRRPAAHPALRCGSALSAYLFYPRRRSATAYVAALRRRDRAGHRAADAPRQASPASARTYYIGYLVVGLGGAVAVWLLRDRIFAALGRSSDLTGRETIWAGRARARQRAADRRLGIRDAVDPVGSRLRRLDHRPRPDRDAGPQHVGRRLPAARASSASILMGLTYLAFIWRVVVLRRRPTALGPARRPAVLRRSRCCRPSSARSCSCRASPSPRPLLLWGWLFARHVRLQDQAVARTSASGPPSRALAIERGELTKQVP